MTIVRICILPVTLLAATATMATAQARPNVGLQLVGESGAVAAMTQSTEVEIEITGLLARTTVTQRFTNHTAGWVEGRYVFPLPEGAAVDALRVTIGDRVIVGQVREKADARQVFERAREQGRSAGLVEQHRANLFSTALTNIAPGEDVEVRIGFGQMVAYEHGRFSLRFPTTTLARYANGTNGAPNRATDAPIAESIPAPHHDRDAPPRLGLSVELHAGLALATVESLHHRVRINGHGSERNIALTDPDRAAGRDFELVWTARNEDRLQGALFVEHMLGRPHALLMLVPPIEFRPVSLKRELILVIDRSGSMKGDAFEQAREAIRLALDRIDPDDRFNVIAFSNTASPLFDGPVRATRANLERAYRFVERLDAGGGTEIDTAMGMAMADHPDSGDNPGYLRQIVFATDGAVANEQQVLERIEREIGDSRLFAVGIGHGVNNAFLGRAARRGHGTTTRIQDPRDIAGRMGELLLQLESPVLEDLQIQWPFPAETWPERIPDLYAGQPLMVLARLDAPGGKFDAGSLRVTGLRDLRFVEMEWPLEHFRSAPGVARAWARARIQGLQDRPAGSMDDWHDNRLRRDERLLTALDYRIVSPLTSLVAVDRTPRRSEAAELKRTAVAGAAPADRDPGALMAMPATDAGTLEAGLRGLSILAIVLLLIFNRRFNRLQRAEREMDTDPGEQS